MKTLFNKIVIVVLFLIVTTGCDKDENTIVENLPLSETLISGAVELPVGSAIDVNSLQIVSPTGSASIVDGTYQMTTMKDKFLTQLVTNANDEVLLMGFNYPGQTDFEINGTSSLRR